MPSPYLRCDAAHAAADVAAASSQTVDQGRKGRQRGSGTGRRAADGVQRLRRSAAKAAARISSADEANQRRGYGAIWR